MSEIQIAMSRCIKKHKFRDLVIFPFLEFFHIGNRKFQKLVLCRL